MVVTVSLVDILINGLQDDALKNISLIKCSRGFLTFNLNFNVKI